MLIEIVAIKNAISEAFRLQQEVGAAREAACKFARETAELDIAYAVQRTNHAKVAKTEAAKLDEAAQFYSDLACEIAQCCGLDPTNTATSDTKLSIASTKTVS